MSNPWRSSPREVDLLSWFTGPLVPILFGGIACTFGLAVTFAFEAKPVSLFLGVLAVFVMGVAFTIIAILASPQRVRGGKLIAILPISVGWVAMILAVASEWWSNSAFEIRWPPIAFGLLLASLAPFVSPRRILMIGVPSFVAVVGSTAANLAMRPDPTQWPLVVDLMLSGGMILVALVAATVFSYQVVARTFRWATSPQGPDLSSGVLSESTKRRVLQQEFASVNDRVLPLLERVTTAGVVTLEDREEAHSLAESLRAELVERSNRSWLESLTRKMNLTVIDHERLAERMNPEQRSALLGLLTAATEEFGAVMTRLVVELRAEADGATAVAVSADRALPEGRKLTLLAPYYVSLVATTDDVTWDTGENLSVRFRVQPKREGSAHRVNRPDPPSAADNASL